MARRKRDKEVPKGTSPLTPLRKPVEIDEIIGGETKKHLLYIVGISLLAKAITIFLTIAVFKTFLDTFGIDFYYTNAINALNGNLPYVNYYYDYPIFVFIPTIIALVPSLILNSQIIFTITFSCLMIFCDCITAFCVYLIAKKIWGSARLGLVAAIIYATSISVAYFAMVEYGPFASCLLMIALTTTIYGKDISGKIPLWMSGYYAVVWGFLAKIYPLIAMPFIILYNAKTTSIKQEVISALKIFIPICVVLVIPFMILNPVTIGTYIPSRLNMQLYPNTIIFTIYSWVHDVIGIGITTDNLLFCTYALMFAGLGTILFSAYKSHKQDAQDLLKYVLCAIVLFVLCSKTRSPQYIIWYAPLLCALIVKDIKKIALYFIVQVVAFAEFPNLFWKLWTNTGYVAPPGSYGWYLALFFFTVEFSLTVALVWWVADPVKIIRENNIIPKIKGV